MRWTRWLVLLLALAVTLTLAACGDDEGTGNPDTSDTAGTDSSGTDTFVQTDTTTDTFVPTDTTTLDTTGDTGTDTTADTTADTTTTGCVNDSTCSGATPACDTATGNCVECTGNSHCTSPDTCNTTTFTCVTPGVAPNPNAANQILAARAQMNPTAIEGAAITYIKPTIGSDPGGFFVQATQDGPAIFVRVDPTTTTPALSVGDIITFSADTFEPLQGRTEVTGISGLSVTASGYDVTQLAQNLTSAADLVTGLNNYTVELVTLTLTVNDSSPSADAPFGSAGTGHSAVTVDTTGVSGAALQLRVPESLVALLGLANGCALTVGPTPLWRYNETPQISAWKLSEISDVTCAAPSLVSAVATTATEARLTFSRGISAASISDVGTQITFDNGLTALAVASVQGNQVFVTTSQQTGGQSYVATVLNSVEDVFGAGIDPAKRNATFTGYLQPAVVRFNEINANITGGCDLVELRVVQGGSMEGFEFKRRTTTDATFGALVVAANDYVVVHFDSADTNCNPAGSANETASTTEAPRASFGANFDNAFDWYVTKDGMEATDNVLSITDPNGNIVDAVLLTNDAARTDPAAASVTAAATVSSAGEWKKNDNTVPSGGYVGADFHQNAVLDLNGTGTDAAGNTIQRNDNDDNDNMGDWTIGVASWGANNTGQSNF